MTYNPNWREEIMDKHQIRWEGFLWCVGIVMFVLLWVTT